MQYSLLSKFQGAFLGAALGNYVGYHFEFQAEKSRKNHKLFINQHKSYLSSLGKNYLQKWGELTVDCAKSLIIKQEFNEDNWHQIYRIWQSKWQNKKGYNCELNKRKDSPIEEELVGIVNNKQSNCNYTNDDVLIPTVSDAIIASLPVSLMYYEDEFKLQEKLQQWGNVWQSKWQVEWSIS